MPSLCINYGRTMGKARSNYEGEVEERWRRGGGKVEERRLVHNWIVHCLIACLIKNNQQPAHKLKTNHSLFLI
jgi:hypothetical protein